MINLKKIKNKFGCKLFYTYLRINIKQLNKMAKETRYDVISPDGFSIHYCDTYETRQDALNAFFEWKKRFEMQGYYSSNKGRISLDELEKHCKLIEVKQFIETF